jgi:hypothetical protein
MDGSEEAGVSKHDNAQILHDLARRWRIILLVCAALKSLGTSFVFLGVLGSLFDISLTTLIIVGFVAAAVTFLIIFFREKSSSFDVKLIARHLNRTIPEFEESSELMLKTGAKLSVLEKMQLERVENALKESSRKICLPNHPLKRASIFIAAASITALLIFAVTSPLSENRKLSILSKEVLRSDSASTRQRRLPLKIESVKVEVTPPNYTGKSKYTLAKLDLSVEEGAQLAWRIEVNQSLRNGSLIFSDSDTLLLQRQSENMLVAKKIITERGFYYLRLANANGEIQSEFYEIDVVEDLPPGITVSSPPLRTEIAPGEPARVNLQIAVEDDYSVTAAELVATVAQGSGESIKFREAKIPFDSMLKKSQRRWEIRHELDLFALGMSAGDELYFHIEAQDNRMPEANRSRSETCFIVLKVTAAVSLSISSGLALNYMPEYFRNQRQIIIDTEKLLSEKNNLSDGEFKRRSNETGADQQALRFRYGQFLGDEFDEAIGVEMIDEHEAEENSGATSDDPFEQFVHTHDSEENATLFASSIKAQLKAALNEMWSAELHLRTYQPKEALPFEYRALDFLKDVQQRSRLYVQRVGFEPSPIKVEEKRLTGDLSKISDRRSNKESSEEKSFPAIRRALPLVQKLKLSQQSLTIEEKHILENAGNELAHFAIEQPGRHLEALGDLRKLILSAINKQELCADCLLSIERSFWQILPPEQPIPSSQRQTHSALSNNYFKKIGSQP